MRAIRDAESRDAVSRLPGRVLQALGLRLLGGISPGSPARCTCRRSASSTRASSRRSIRSSRHLGRRRRTRHAVRRGGRRGAGELREDVSYRCAARGLAVRARRAVCSSVHAVLPVRRRTTSLGLVPGPIRRADTRHAAIATDRRGKILYLEQLTVSFDGFKALNDLDAVRRSGRAALHHRSQRRRQDHDDGRDHRQDPPDVRARRGSAGTLDLLKLTEPEIAPGWHRPEVSEAHGVRAADRVRESRAGAGRRKSPSANPVRARLTPAQRKRIDEVLGHHRACRSARTPGERPVARTEAVARDRHAADAGTGAAAGRRAGRRHDAAGNRAHGGAAPVACRQTLGGRRRARHGFRAIDRTRR